MAVAVEIEDNKPRFATMRQVGCLSAAEIHTTLTEHLPEDWVVRTDGWPSYGIFDSLQGEHQPVVTGPGGNAVRLLPWVHTVIANVKGNIRGVYHGVSSKHLGHYLAEFCYRFNRRFCEPQMFDRMLTACLATNTTGYSGLRK